MWPCQRSVDHCKQRLVVSQAYKNITSAAANKFDIAKSCFRSTSIPVLRLILKAFIIPSLEYGSVMWNPHLRHEIDSLEEVQRRISALTLGKHMSYARRLKVFDLRQQLQRDSILKDRHSIIDLVTYQKFFPTEPVLTQHLCSVEHTVITANEYPLFNNAFMPHFCVLAFIPCAYHKSLELSARLSCDNSAFRLFCQGRCHALRLVTVVVVYIYVYLPHSQWSLQTVSSPCTCKLTYLFIMPTVNY